MRRALAALPLVSRGTEHRQAACRERTLDGARALVRGVVVVRSEERRSLRSPSGRPKRRGRRERGDGLSPGLLAAPLDRREERGVRTERATRI